MDDGMEHTNIVEFYPGRFEELPEWLLHIDMCSVRITGTHFTRTVYHPLIGPDVLMAQREVERTYGFQRNFSVPSSRLALYDDLMDFLPEITYPTLGEHRRLNPDLNWENLADRISRYAESQGFCLQGRSPEIFELSVTEAFGELSIMSDAWHGIAPAPPTDILECILCNQDMTHGNSIALHCGHVFHKDCFFPVLWANEREGRDTTCSVCGCDLHLL